MNTGASDRVGGGVRRNDAPGWHQVSSHSPGPTLRPENGSSQGHNLAVTGLSKFARQRIRDDAPGWHQVCSHSPGPTLRPENGSSQGHNLAATGLFVPSSRDRGIEMMRQAGIRYVLTHLMPPPPPPRASPHEREGGKEGGSGGGARGGHRHLLAGIRSILTALDQQFT